MTARHEECNDCDKRCEWHNENNHRIKALEENMKTNNENVSTLSLEIGKLNGLILQFRTGAMTLAAAICVHEFGILPMLKKLLVGG